MIAELFITCALALPPQLKEEEYHLLVAYLKVNDPMHEYIFTESPNEPTKLKGWRKVDVRLNGLYIWRKKITIAA